MKIPALLLSSSLLLAASCASAPTLTDVWRDSSVHELAAEKTLVLATNSEESFRRVAEDEFVRHLAKGSGIPSYGLLAASDTSEPKKVLERARSQGIDTALVLRVLDVDKVEQHVPGAYSPVFLHFTDGSHTTAYLWPTRFDEGWSYMEKTYRVETSLYSLVDDKLVWSGVMQVRDPGSVRELVAEVSEAVVGTLRGETLLR